jgi:hypothetical protein
MSLLSKMRRERQGPPFIGIPVAELTAALALVETTEGLRDRRVMWLNVCNNGMLRVRTGEQASGLCGGGHELLIQKTQEGWEVVEIEGWVS